MIADDHGLVREGIKKIIENDGSIKVVGEVSNGQECLDKILTIKPDILILDINMPKLSGLQVLEEIKKRKYNVKVLILTAHNEIDYLIRTLDFGVEGYLIKDTTSFELIKSIHCIYEGKTYIQSNLIPYLNNELIMHDSDIMKVDSLTKREMEILIYISKGMCNKEIAFELDISERTVKNHISNLFKKISVVDRTQAAVFAIKNDIINL